jgi:peptidoglycan/LPS O-acetylase OafA/YrhL
LVISGYVIGRSTLQREEQGELSFGSFISRRARRILPALSAMLCVTLLLSTWLSPLESRVVTVRTGVFASFGGSNLFLARFRPDDYFAQTEKLNALLHTWSLGLEEQMYLFFAIVLLVIARLSKSGVRRISALVFGTAGVASIGLCLVASTSAAPGFPLVIQRLMASDQFDDRLAFYLPMARVWEFLVGVLLAYTTRVRFRESINRSLAWLGYALLALSAWQISGAGYPGYQVLLPVTATVLAIHFGHSDRQGASPVARMLSWIGDRSYGLYLWHWPLLVFASVFSDAPIVLFGAVVVSVMISDWSFRYLEVPIRVSPKLGEGRTLRRISFGAVVAPLVVSVVTYSPIPDLDLHLDTKLGCTSGPSNDLGAGGKCVLAIEGATDSVALVGDSHAGHLSDGMEIAARNLNMSLLLGSRAGAPFLVGPQASETDAVLKLIVDQRVKVAVIAQSNYSVPDDEWYKGMREVLQTLTSSGIGVVLVAQSLFPDQAPLKCSYLKIISSMCQAEVSLSTSELLSQRDRFSSEQRLISEFPQVVHLDTARFLCPSGSCEIRRQGRWWWRDGGHISVFASRQLAAPLQQAIAMALSRQV